VNAGSPGRRAGRRFVRAFERLFGFTCLKWREELSIILRSLPPPSAPGGAVRVIDVGCGSGRMSLELARRGYDVTGIDLDRAKVEKARRRCKEWRIPAGFYRSDAACIPFRDAAFDAAVLNCSLEHVGRDERALREVYRVLAPGGSVVLTVPDSRMFDPTGLVGATAFVRRAWRAALRDPTPFACDDAALLKAAIDAEYSHVHSYTPRRIREMLEGVGFERVRLDSYLVRSGALGVDMAYSMGAQGVLRGVRTPAGLLWFLLLRGLSRLDALVPARGIGYGLAAAARKPVADALRRTSVRGGPSSAR